jgi:hypothetical protein
MIEFYIWIWKIVIRIKKVTEFLEYENTGEIEYPNIKYR